MTSRLSYMTDAAEALVIPTHQINRDHILFDAFSSQFSVGVCLEQFLMHLTFPLLIPYFIYKYGFTFLYTQRFLHIGNYAAIATFYIMIIAFIKAPENIGLQFIFPLGVFLMHRFMVSVKYGTLSPSEYSKMMHGGLNGKQYSLPSEETKRIVRDYQEQLQLLSGWLFLRHELVEFEVLTAAGCLGIDLHQYSFQISNPSISTSAKRQFAQWQNLLTSSAGGLIRGLKENADRSYSVPVHHVLVSILLGSDPQFMRRVMLLSTTLITLVNACIPLIMARNDFKGMSLWGITYYISAFLLNVSFSFAVLAFVQTAFIDFYRRLQCARALESLIRSTEIDTGVKVSMVKAASFHAHDAEVLAINKILERSSTYKMGDDQTGTNSLIGKRSVEMSSSSDRPSPSARTLSSFSESIAAGVADYGDMLPKLDLRIPSNITAWAICRTTLHNFGSRVRFRLDVTNGLVLFLSLLLIIAMLSALIRHNRIDLTVTTPLLHAVLWVYLFAFSEAIIIFMGHLVNVFMSKHRSVLSLHLLKLKHKLQCFMETSLRGCHYPRGHGVMDVQILDDEEAISDQAVFNQYSDTVHTLEVVLEVLQNRDEVDPVRILGIKCHSQLSLWIITTLLVATFAVFQLAVIGGSFYDEI